MNRRQIKSLARFRAGLILESVLGNWDPDDLAEKYGDDVVDEISKEIQSIADRLQGDSR